MRRLLRPHFKTAFVFAAIFLSAQPTKAADCAPISHARNAYTVCTVDPSTEAIRLFLNDKDNAPLRHFSNTKKLVETGGEKLVMAMNGGMYHRDRTPVGLYIENGAQHKSISTRPGPGNFHMLPNGVFYVSHEEGRDQVNVLSTEAYKSRTSDKRIIHATQSGPMLVIDGSLHPRFIPNSDSLKKRNGVGVREDGTVVFAISEGVVNFYDFAILFRDQLDTPNALYLDGTISRLYAPELDRDDFGVAMGPIIGVVSKD